MTPSRTSVEPMKRSTAALASCVRRVPLALLGV
jgi:hypothetical protein